MLLIMEKLTENIRKKISGFVKLGRLDFIKTFICICYTFCVTCVTWVLFRADTFGDAFYIIKKLFSGIPEFVPFDKAAALFGGIPRQNLYVSVFGIILLLAGDILCRKSDFRTAVGKIPVYARIPLYASLVCLILVFGAYESKSFIYFQF